MDCEKLYQCKQYRTNQLQTQTVVVIIIIISWNVEIEFYCMNDRDLINSEAICSHLFPGWLTGQVSLRLDCIFKFAS